MCSQERDLIAYLHADAYARSALNARYSAQAVRQKRAAVSVAGGDEASHAAEEETLREQMEAEKRSYKEARACRGLLT